MGAPGVAAGGRVPMLRRLPRWAWVALACVLVAGLGAAWVLLRPGARATVDGVTIECAAATGVDAQVCRAWGESILAEGPGARVFELEDVVRIAIDRDLFGLGQSCELEWVIGRYPNRPALSEELACR